MNWLSAPLITLTHIQFEKDLGTITSRYDVQKEEEVMLSYIPAFWRVE
jgi:hypothetical protein